MYFLLSINKVDFNKKVINGDVYDDRERIKKFLYLDIIFNDCGKINKK